MIGLRVGLPSAGRGHRAYKRKRLGLARPRAPKRRQVHYMESDISLTDAGGISMAYQESAPMWKCR